MRSLSLLSVAHTSLSASEFTSSGQPPSITATAVDLDQNVLLIATERRDVSNDSEATVAIWRLREAEAPDEVSVGPIA